MNLKLQYRAWNLPYPSSHDLQGTIKIDHSVIALKAIEENNMTEQEQETI